MSTRIVWTLLWALLMTGCARKQLQPGQLSMAEMERRQYLERRVQADKGEALLAEGRALTAQQAAAKVSALKAAPQDQVAYTQLMRYYEFHSDIKGKNALILWYIENSPDGAVRPWNINPAWDRASYEAGRTLWLRNVKRAEASATTYDRAAAFLAGGDKALAEEVLLAGRKAFPNDLRWPYALASHYAHTLLGAAEPLTEFNVVRTVSNEQAHSPYTRSVREKLATTKDAALLAGTARALMIGCNWARIDGSNVALLQLMNGYVDRALALEPANRMARNVQEELPRFALNFRAMELMKLPPEARAKLNDSDRLLLTMREMELAWIREETTEATAKAKELLELAPRQADAARRCEAIYEADITLGKAALRAGSKREAVRYLLAAARDGQLRAGLGMVELNLPRALVDWGEREAAAQFLEQMASKTPRSEEWRTWAGQIRQGINPDLRPTRSGCAKGPC